MDQRVGVYLRFFDYNFFMQKILIARFKTIVPNDHESIIKGSCDLVLRIQSHKSQINLYQKRFSKKKKLYQKHFQ